MDMPGSSQEIEEQGALRLKLTLREKELIIGHYMENNSMSLTAKIMRRSKSVVGRVVKRYQEENSLEEKPRSGRPKVTTSREDRAIVKMSMSNRFETAASIAREFNKTMGKTVCSNTVSRRLNERGLKARVPISKPLISKKNQKLRLEYAYTHVLWDENEWSRMFFSDESKFNVFGSDGSIYVRRRLGESLSPNCTKKTVKFGGGSVMVWGMISAAGVGPLVRLYGKVNANVYKQLLDQTVVEYLHSTSDEAIFMQDNAPCHKAKKVLDFLEQKGISTFEWPPQSPDLNPIENVWKLVGERARKNNPKNQDELWRFLKIEWNKITPSFCKDLVNSCNRRCQAVIDNKGLFTKY